MQPDERPRLWRTPIEISGDFEEIPPPPEGPIFFGLSEASTKIRFNKVALMDSAGGPPSDGATVELTAVSLADDEGAVLSSHLHVIDAQGNSVVRVSVAISEADAAKIGPALQSLLELARQAR